jgi:serine/threonine-protein kinase
MVLLDKYRIDRVLGRGGMGVVLQVTHLQLGECLALKILLPELVSTPDVITRFVREAQAAVRLRGEHVARVTDVGVFPDGAPYMVMDYLVGNDLAGELERRRALAAGEAVDYVLQACEALAEAHAIGIIHRDLKPANLFLTRRPDGTPLIKVLDFGISKASMRNTVITHKDSVLGTPGYMSPEQIRSTKDVDARTDIWSLGVVLYELLEGRCPFDLPSFPATVLMTMTEPPPAMTAKLPRGLPAVILRCLEKDRAKRYSSIAALAAALAPFARERRSAAATVDRTSLIYRSSATRIAMESTRMQPAIAPGGGAGEPPHRATPPWHRRSVLVAAGAVGSVSAFAITVLLARAPLPASRALASTVTGDVSGSAAVTIAAPAPIVEPIPPERAAPPPDAGEPARPPVATAAPARAPDPRAHRGVRSAAIARPAAPEPASPPEVLTPAAPARRREVVVDPWADPPARAEAAAPPSGCTHATYDDTSRQAANEYRAGHPKPALALLLTVIGCTDEVRDHRLAVLYACAAQNESVAKLWIRRIPPAYRGALIQRCMEQGISLPAP